MSWGSVRGTDSQSKPCLASDPGREFSTREVGGGEQALDDLATLGCAEVDPKAALTGVQGQKERRLTATRFTTSTPIWIAGEHLDLDDIRTERGEQSGCLAAGDETGEVEDARPVQWPAHQHLGLPEFAECGAEHVGHLTDRRTRAGGVDERRHDVATIDGVAAEPVHRDSVGGGIALSHGLAEPFHLARPGGVGPFRTG